MLCTHHTLSFFILEKYFHARHSHKLNSTPSLAQQPQVGQGLLIIEALRSHSRHTTIGRTPLDEGSARHRVPYLTAHNTHNRQTSMPQAGFEPTIPGEQRAADPRLRPRGHRDRHDVKYPCKLSLKFG